MISPGVYRHYKTRNRYRVLFIGTDWTNTSPTHGQFVVIYIGLYDGGAVGVRLASEFEEMVGGVPRFERVGE